MRRSSVGVGVRVVLSTAGSKVEVKLVWLSVSIVSSSSDSVLVEVLVIRSCTGNGIGNGGDSVRMMVVV